MSDRSPLQLFVYAAHEDEHDVIMQIMDEEDFELEWTDEEESRPGLVLGRRYGIDETPLGRWEDVATALRTRAPSAVFKLWQDPHYSADGRFVAHVPGVGTYETGCASDGTPCTDVPDLVELLTAAPAGTTVQEWLAGPGGQSLGVAVLAALDSYENLHQ
ncbi:hypothetical protein [Embleya sp. MST-111070]|uniref:hypothetical protein n=1 Tax=Embleya sp. MST-111070 TaxID=3398231 RepID=UPI003F73F46E